MSWLERGLVVQDFVVGDLEGTRTEPVRCSSNQSHDSQVVVTTTRLPSTTTGGRIRKTFKEELSSNIMSKIPRLIIVLKSFRINFCSAPQPCELVVSVLIKARGKKIVFRLIENSWPLSAFQLRILVKTLLLKQLRGEIAVIMSLFCRKEAM